jgi:hypothetical protein
MPDAEFGLRHRHLGVVAASAVSVVAVVAVVALVAQPWRDTAARSPAARIGPATSSDSPLASAATSLPAVSVSEPAFSAEPASSPAATSGPPAPPSTTAPVSRRMSPTAPAVVGDKQINFKVSVQVSPTQLVWGQQVRVTVMIVNAGGVFDRPVEMFFQGSDPSDNVSEAPPGCTANGAIVCPITGVRPGRKWSFTFNFIPGTFPAMDHFDDAVYAAFNYTDSHGQQQQTPAYYAHVLLFNPPASPPPASGAPSNTPPPSSPPASASATSAPQSGASPADLGVDLRG